jgi:hypothetical protein
LLFLLFPLRPQMLALAISRGAYCTPASHLFEHGRRPVGRRRSCFIGVTRLRIRQFGKSRSISGSRSVSSYCSSCWR